MIIPHRKYILFYKPFRVLCQFSRDGDKSTLADFIHIPGVYPAGRLDYDSEGLVLLTGDGAFQHRLTDPRHAHPRTYWVQVEGTPTPQAAQSLERGVPLDGRLTLPCKVQIIEEPPLPPRVPPIRVRRNIPTSWLAMTLTEGRNRQVRRMTAAVGFPTLRLVRAAIGHWTLAGLAPGEWRELTPAECRL